MSNVKEELIEKRKSAKTFDDLVAFLKDVYENYNVSYEDSPIAIAQACLSVAWFLTGVRHYELASKFRDVGIYPWIHKDIAKNIVKTC